MAGPICTKKATFAQSLRHEESCSQILLLKTLVSTLLALLESVLSSDARTPQVSFPTLPKSPKRYQDKHLGLTADSAKLELGMH